MKFKEIISDNNLDAKSNSKKRGTAIKQETRIAELG